MSMSEDSGIFPIPLKKPARFTWSKANPVSLSLVVTIAGWLIVYGAQREGQHRDTAELRESVKALQASVKEFGDKVDRLSEKGPEVDSVSLKNLDQRLSRLEKNWDDAGQIAGTYTRPRKHR